MKHIGLTVLAAALSIGFCGCISIRTTKGSDDYDGDKEVFVVDDVEPNSKAMLAEIDATSKRFSESAKEEQFINIARRKPLPNQVQTYLVKATFTHLFSEFAKENVLLAIIKNPNFSQEGKMAILGNIDNLFFGAQQKKNTKSH